MSKEDVKEFQILIKALIKFTGYCVPYFVMIFPMLVIMITGKLYWGLLLPVSIFLGIISKGAISVALDGFNEN